MFIPLSPFQALYNVSMITSDPGNIVSVPMSKQSRIPITRYVYIYLRVNGIVFSSQIQSVIREDKSLWKERERERDYKSIYSYHPYTKKLFISVAEKFYSSS